MRSLLVIITYACLINAIFSHDTNESQISQVNNPTPIVIWHGMGDNCCHSFSMGRIKQMLEEHIKGKSSISKWRRQYESYNMYIYNKWINYLLNFFLCITGVYVRSLMIGASPNEDTLNGFFLPVSEQIDMVCQKIKEDPNLRNGYNGMGFSQGGQFMRAISEICPHGMKKLISFGGQHQGIYGNIRLK